jgi:hypothetical protein
MIKTCIELVNVLKQDACWSGWIAANSAQG